MGIEGEELGGWPTGSPWGFAAAAADADMNATEALNAYREAGGAIRTQTWYRGWGQVEAGRSDRVTLQGGAFDALPDAGAVTTWSTRTADGYLYHFDLTVRDAESGELTTTLASIRSDDLLTPADALNDLMDLYGDNAEAYGEAIVGGVLLNIFAMRPGG